MASRRSASLVVGVEHDWFWLRPEGRPVPLARRPVLRRVLAALCEAHERSEGPLSVEQLAARGWPGERMVGHSAAARVYAAVRTLRRLGLAPLLVTTPRGYCLRPEVPLVRDDTPAELVETLPRLPEPPPEADTFVGRAEELERLTGWLLGEERLVTILGPGGVGKSRLATRVAREVGAALGACFFVEVGTARRLGELMRLVAAPLDVPLRGADPLGRLALALDAHGPMLLVLDGLERLAEEVAPALSRWLEEAPRLRLLCTSRIELDLPAERRLRLDPLPEEEAVELLRERALRAGANLWDTSEEQLRALVRAVEPLPLNVELAAARARLLSAEELLVRARSRLELLVDRGHSERSLRASLESSWTLLEPAGRAALCALSVFAAPFDVAAAERVLRAALPGQEPIASLELLDRHSLLQRRAAHAGSHFRLLDGVREFARSAAEDDGTLREVRRRAMRGLGEHLAERYGPRLEERLASERRPELLDELLREDANLQAAALGAARAGEWDLFIPLVEALFFGWVESGSLHRAEEALRLWSPRRRPTAAVEAMLAWMRGTVDLAAGRYEEAEAHFEQTLAVPEEEAGAEAHGRALLGLTTLTLQRHRAGVPAELLERATRFLEERGLSLLLARLRLAESAHGFFTGNLDLARRALRQGIREAVAGRWPVLEVRLQTNAALLAYYCEAHWPDEVPLRRLIERTGRLRLTPSHCQLRLLLGFRLAARGRLEEAAAQWRTALHLLERSGQREYARHQGADVVRAWLDAGRPEEAMALLAEHMERFGDVEPPPSRGADVEWHALAARALGETGGPPERVERFRALAEEALRGPGAGVLQALVRCDLARAALAAGDLQEVRRQLELVEARLDQLGVEEGCSLRAHWRAVREAAAAASASGRTPA